jgi:hypothetical protein
LGVTMPSHLIFTRILIDGGILTTIMGLVLVGMLYFYPRLALSDYPTDVKAAVPPRTKKELYIGILISIPLLIVLLAIPLYSVWLVKQQNGGILNYGMAFITILGEYILFSLFDLLVLDLWMFYTWTPKFLVLPGTESMAGYKDYRPHLKSQLTKGNLLLVLISAVLALIPVIFY